MQTGLRAVFRSRPSTSPFQWRGAQHLQVKRTGSLHFRALHTKRYTKEHELVKFDDATGVGIVSITDHAQSVLGDVVFVELLPVGTNVVQGEEIGAVESVKAASDIYAPVSGTVEAINEALSDEPGLLNKSSEDKGWLCKIKLSDPTELDKLLTWEDYKKTYVE